MATRRKSRPEEGGLFLGLMSGTSADGVDAALVRISAAAPGGISLLGYRRFPYPEDLRCKVLEACSPQGTVELLCRLNFVLGEVFAEAAGQLLAEVGVTPGEVVAIGSHGQTVRHLPGAEPCAGYRLSSTLQIAEPCVIAERTGITTVADFRPRDMAAGGQGAPLLPYLHFCLFSRQEYPVGVLNLGGIANLTYLPAGGRLEQVLAFDTGPGNMLIDGVTARLFGQAADWEGRLAASGKVCPELLAQLEGHEYLAQKPPKSTGREEFGAPLADDVCRRAKRAHISPQDVVHTVTLFSAKAVARAFYDFLPREGLPREVFLCGGGVRNNTLVGFLFQELSGIHLRFTDEFGFPAEAIEAMGFALLAYLSLQHRPGNLPSVTGASHPVVLGKIVPGRGWPFC